MTNLPSCISTWPIPRLAGSAISLRAQDEARIQNASHVNAANSATVISGGDTNLTGSQVNAKQVTAEVGGNLNIASVQDVTTSAAHQSNVGGGISVSQAGGVSGSISAQKGHADSNYAGVNEQAGLNAGDGGFSVNVKGNTDLKGGVIASTSEAERNSLTTGTLTFSDIENRSHYSANSMGGSAGLSPGPTQEKAVGPASVPGAGGVVPMIAQHEGGDQSATTRSAVSAGTVSVTDTAHQTQDVASLRRDTTDTNGKVSDAPDVNSILNQQADTMQAAQAAGQVVAQGIAAYADGKKADAQKAADAAKTAGDMDAYNAAMADVKSWSEGGANRMELHIVGGALLGGLGGGGMGSAAAGAAGAGVASALAGKLNGLADEIGGATGSMTLGNVTSNVLAGLGGAVVGGGMGAFTASNADLYNRQLHPEEKTLAKQLADKSGGKYTQAQIEDQMRLMGVSVDGGSVPPGVAEELNGRIPTDPGAQWINTGLTNANGNPLVIQSLPQTNQALQSFIMENYNSASPGAVPSAYTYIPTPVGMDVRGTVANVAGGVSTAAGRFGAVTAAGAAIPSPYAPALGTAAFAATTTGWVADFVGQLMQPNPGAYVTGGIVDLTLGGVANKYPLAGPVITELATQIKETSPVKQAADKLNDAIRPKK